MKIRASIIHEFSILMLKSASRIYCTHANYIMHIITAIEVIPMCKSLNKWTYNLTLNGGTSTLEAFVVNVDLSFSSNIDSLKRFGIPLKLISWSSKILSLRVRISSSLKSFPDFDLYYYFWVFEGKLACSFAYTITSKKFGKLKNETTSYL